MSLTNCRFHLSKLTWHLVTTNHLEVDDSVGDFGGVEDLQLNPLVLHGWHEPALGPHLVTLHRPCLKAARKG